MKFKWQFFILNPDINAIKKEIRIYTNIYTNMEKGRLVVFGEFTQLCC